MKQPTEQKYMPQRSFQDMGAKPLRYKVMQDDIQSDHQIGEQVVRADRVRTVQAYRQIITPWADECRCAPCRNFAPQRKAAFPLEFVSLLTQLGIDPLKESEVFGCYPMPSGKRQYSGWFFFCGKLLTVAHGEVSKDGISYYVRGPGDMPAPGQMFEPHPLALEFTVEFPWILLDENPDDLYGPPAKAESNKTCA